MGSRSYMAAILVGFAVLVFSMSAFTVSQTDLAIKFRFGEIVRADYEPGLHFMTPLVNNVRKFDKRVLTEDYPAEQFLTSEGKILKIDFFVKWRISDVSRYYTSTAGGSEDVAARRLGEIVKDGLKGVIARRTIQQVVAAERTEFLGEVLKIAGANVGGLGMTMIDVRVKSIGLPDEVSESVYNRMSQDFARQAAQLRAEGSAVSEQTRAEADRQRTEILANAYREAEMVKGEGDATAADIYAQAYGKNADFFSFFRSLQAYRKSLGKQGDVLVLTPDGEFFKYFKESGRCTRPSPERYAVGRSLGGFRPVPRARGTDALHEPRWHEGYAQEARRASRQRAARRGAGQHDRRRAAPLLRARRRLTQLRMQRTWQGTW